MKLAVEPSQGACPVCHGAMPNGHHPGCPYRKASAAAFDSAVSTAAPLLGGFTLTLIGLIASKPEQFRWPGWTVLSLTAAILLFVACIEAGFFTRQYRPDFDDTSLAPDQEEERRYQRWSGAARETYDLAIVLLFTGLGAVLAPTSQSDSLPRWAAAGLCWVAATAELIWHFSAHRRLRVHKAA